ncbi:hypothetical protein FRC17_011167 [Serendipita sp. 399]|nr:hypothetical protein FRC17_011167 [Serendipita sp. 399]
MAAPYEKAPQTASAYTTTFTNADVEIQSPVKAESSYFDEKDHQDTHSLGRKTPTRKYSAKWWKRTWDGAVRLGTWPRLIYCGIGVTLILLWLAVMLIFIGNEVNYEQQNAGETPERQGRNHQLRNGSVLLKGTLVSFDAGKRSLAVTWSGLYKMDSESTVVDLGGTYDQNSTSYFDGIGIYRDVSSAPVYYSYNYTGIDDTGNHGNFTFEGFMYRVDNETAKPVGVIGMHPWDSFDTDIQFTQLYSKNVWRQPMLGYPFDRWQGGIVFVANDIGWAKADNVTGGDVFELAGMQLADSTLNWRISYKFNNTCQLENINYTDVSTFAPNCHLDIKFEAVRPPLVIFAAVTAVVVNWTCTLFIFILTCEAIIMRRGVCVAVAKLNKRHKAHKSD